MSLEDKIRPIVKSVVASVVNSIQERDHSRLCQLEQVAESQSQIISNLRDDLDEVQTELLSLMCNEPVKPTPRKGYSHRSPEEIVQECEPITVIKARVVNSPSVSVSGSTCYTSILNNGCRLHFNLPKRYFDVIPRKGEHVSLTGYFDEKQNRILLVQDYRCHEAESSESQSEES